MELQAAEQEEAERKRMEERLRPLGFLRIRSLGCTGGGYKLSPAYFYPPEDIDIFTAYRNYAVRIWEEFHTQSHGYGLSLLALARLLSGDLDAADVIIDNLPAEPYRIDHGAGYCVVLPQNGTAAILPLPKTLKEFPGETWLAGSQVQADVRAWLNEHRDKLRWDEKECLYRLAE